MPGSADYRRRADEYRALSTKAASRREREGLLSVAMLLEALAQHEVERMTHRNITSSSCGQKPDLIQKIYPRPAE